MSRLSFFSATVISLFLLSACGVQYPKNIEEKPPVSHEIWDSLLKKHVDDQGFVDYKGMMKDSVQLNKYLALLSGSHPNKKSWTREEQMAYWINAYNAFTVRLILDHYPVNSIKDIKQGIPFVNTVWDIKFISIQGQEYDLNNIEHGILREFWNDARIHAAVNCASYSCPPLRGEAFTAGKLDDQLDDSMKQFINDSRRNRITAGKAELSEIFNWFKGDFKDDAGSVQEFINRYADQKITDQTAISYLDYDWKLNDAGK